MTAPSPLAADGAAARVRDGLRALVRDPSAWPPGDARAWRSRLLDHGGGDSHAHVALAWEAHAWGVADRLRGATGEDARTRVRHVARAFAASHFTEPEAARWVVQAWAEALGIASVEAGEPAPPSPTPSDASAMPTTRDGRAQAPTRSAPTRSAPTRSAPTRSAPTRPAMPRAPLPRVPAGRLAILGVGGIASMMLGIAWLMRVVTPEATLVAAPSPSARAPRATPELAPPSGRVPGVGGTYRVTTTNVWIGGDDACRDPAAAPADGAVSLERVVQAPGEATVSLASRPGVRATLADDGSFAATGLAGARGTTSWRLAWSGRFEGGGFHAVTDLRTATLGAWRRITRCRIVATLVGVRLGP